MANWRFKIELNRVITEMAEEYDLDHVEEECPACVKRAIAIELRKAPPLKQFASEVLKCKTIAAVNRVLQRIFDHADSCGVWCGFSQ